MKQLLKLLTAVIVVASVGQAMAASGVDLNVKGSATLDVVYL